jgi:16S rRNA processing protein RimM
VLVTLGRVGRPHGTDGSFVVEGGSRDPRRFAVGASVLVDGAPATVVAFRRVGKGRLAIRLDRPVERGAGLAVRREDLGDPEDGAFYVADLVGLEVVEQGGERLGLVEDVLPGPANDALELDTGRLLPLVEDCVLEVDLAARRVLVAPGFAGDG